MYKLFVFAAILSIAAAYPSLLAPAAILPHPAVVSVGVPAAISHSSISQVHAPIIGAPLLTAPLLASPLGHPAPLLVHG